MLQERSTGRSRGFGYATFASVEDAKVTRAYFIFISQLLLVISFERLGIGIVWSFLCRPIYSLDKTDS